MNFKAMQTSLAAATLWLLLFASWSSAQRTWTHQAPSPTSLDVRSVHLVSATEAWAVGDGGVLLHTTDAGRTFERRILDSVSLWKVFFLDAQLGWAVGNDVFYTENSGVTWTKVNQTFGTLDNVQFVDPMHGFGCGNGGTIYLSSDGGRSWTTSTLPSIATVRGIHFRDALNGWVVNIDGEIYRSVNGGQSFDAVHTVPAGVNSIWFADALEGFVTGGDMVFHTLDGGQSWQQLPVPSNTWTYSTCFLDRTRHFGAGPGMNIVATGDGWQTSETQSPMGSGRTLRDIDFADPLHGMAVGEKGTVLYTDDGGAHWTERQQGGGGWHHRIRATDAAHAWAALEGGEVTFTTDGGQHWRRRSVTGFSSYGTVQDVSFLEDNLHGWAVGWDADFFNNTGKIVRSVDGGRSWVQQWAGQGIYLQAVVALDERTAVAAGWAAYASFILRTENGGLTWTDVTPPVLGAPSCMDFVDENVGWIAGGRIFKTVDGGRTWTEQDMPEELVNDISFADAQNGWAVGWWGFVFHTTDGGQTWTRQTHPVIGSRTVLAVDAISPSTVWVSAADYVGSGVNILARSVDSGATWASETVPTYRWNNFTGVSFIDANYGWVAGSTVDPRGGVWKRTDGPPPGLALLHGRLFRGSATMFEISGASPNDRVYFLVSLSGIGQGSCLGGLCLDLLDPIVPLGPFTAGWNGGVQFWAAVPASAPLIEGHFQAITIGSGGGKLKSNTTSAVIAP